MTRPASLLPLAAGQKSAEVTDWSGRIGWIAGLLLFVVLVYWLMRQGWKWRGSLQSGLPELPTAPEAPGEPQLPAMTGRYHGSTTAGQWLDRIVAHGLGARSRAELTLTDAGLEVVRPGANDFFVPAAQLREARLDKGIAGKVLTEGGLLIVTWQLGDRLIDSGFRSDRSAEHPAWVAAINSGFRSGGSGSPGAPGRRGARTGAGAPAAPAGARTANSPDRQDRTGTQTTEEGAS